MSLPPEGTCAFYVCRAVCPLCGSILRVHTLDHYQNLFLPTDCKCVNCGQANYGFTHPKYTKYHRLVDGEYYLGVNDDKSGYIIKQKGANDNES